MKRFRSFLWEAWLPLALVLAWLIFSAASQSFYFPPLADIFAGIGTVWFFDGIMSDLLPSLIRLTIGFFGACLLGVIGGTILGLMPRFEDSVRPILEFIRATPGIAILPIAIIFLGIGNEMKTFMIAFGSMWPVLLNTIDGVRSVEPTLLRMARSYRMPMWLRIRRIYIPNAAPQIFAGARLALAIAATVMVVTEMVGTPGGIGYFILESQRTFMLLNMWTGIIVLGVLGYLLNLAFRVVESKVLYWHHQKNA